jgi:hypothetical protein
MRYGAVQKEDREEPRTELVTTRTFMASELLLHLMSTPFQRTAAEGQEEITLTLVVLRASAGSA